MYGLRQQALMGPCNEPKPGVFDPVGRAKWSAWEANGQMSKEDAKKAFLELFDKIRPGWDTFEELHKL